jgi:hypothetical protein
LNEVLSQLWDEFERALARGEIKQIEPEIKDWVKDALAGVPIIDAEISRASGS